MAPPKVSPKVSLLYSVDITEYPGLVPEIGTGRTAATLEILASVQKPASSSPTSVVCSRSCPVPSPFLGPAPTARPVSCFEDVDEKYCAAKEKSTEASEYLRQALRRRGTLSARASVRREEIAKPSMPSTRANSRSSGRASSRAESSRLSMRTDGVDSRQSYLRDGAGSRLSSARGDSRLSMREDGTDWDSRFSVRADGEDSRFSMKADGEDSRFSVRADSRISTRADSRMSARADADSRMSTRADSRMSGRASVDFAEELLDTSLPPTRCSSAMGQAPVGGFAEPPVGCFAVPDEYAQSRPEWKAPAPHIDHECTCYVPAVFPFPEPTPQASPSRKVHGHHCLKHPVPPGARFRRPATAKTLEVEVLVNEAATRMTVSSPTGYARSKPSRMEAENEGQKMKMLAADFHFQLSNRKQANAWIADTVPDVWTPEKNREPWVIAADERRRAFHERMRIFKTVEPMPFEHWLADVLEVERALFGSRDPNVRALSDPKPHVAEATDEHARAVLKDMGDHAKRGTVHRQDRDIAQQVALASLRRHWGKSTDHQKGFDHLALEVRNGETTLADHHGMIVRVVASISYRITFKGSVLVELGAWKSGKCTHSTRLPSAKLHYFERVEDALHRELNVLLVPFRAGMTNVGQQEFHASQGHSEHGITTHYHRSMQHSTIVDNFEFPMLPLCTYTDVNEVPHMCRQYHVFCLRFGTKIKLFAWLKQDDYEFLSHTDGKAILAKWIDVLVCDETSALDALDWTLTAVQPKGQPRLRCSLVAGLKSAFVEVTSPKKDAKKCVGIGGYTLADELREKQAAIEQQAKEDDDKRKTICKAARVLCKATQAGTRVAQSDHSDGGQAYAVEQFHHDVEVAMAPCQKLKTPAVRDSEKQKSGGRGSSKKSSIA